MGLYTKCIRAPPQKEDGIRICVMRRPYKEGIPYGQFDLWMRGLAPSDELLTKRVHQGMVWEPFATEYAREIEVRFSNPKKPNLVHLLTKFALQQDITILCMEYLHDECHRSILAKLCERRAEEIGELLPVHLY